ncbi:MAG: acetamidase/formamidase family protein [Candidatus Bathyarchaeota archaeon]|nr:acetamidase/formamidase family protein [Candidatus Bathyarchaeota archaeon]
MKSLGRGTLHFTIGPLNEPVLTVEPGETVVVETEDAFIGMIREPGDWKDNAEVPWSNPVSGPIYVEGAEKGDTLVVDIRDIQPLTGQGATRVSGLAILSSVVPVTQFMRTDLPRKVWICPIRDGRVYWKDLALPYRPMIGTIGTAPEKEAVSSNLAGAHGGNMDLREVCPGNRLYLPVNVEGALLHLGDVHAVQGDGELCGTAVEMPARNTIAVGLIKGKAISWPRIESGEHIMAVGVGRPMEDAIRIAFSQLIYWLEQEHGFDAWDAYNLCTQIAEISVGWYTQASVAAKFPKRYLPFANE